MEEAKRQAALDRQGAEAGDTRWVLSFEDQKGSIAAPRLAIRVVQAGYAHLDVPQINGRSIEEESGEEKPAMVGRRSFGKFNKVLEVCCYIYIKSEWELTLRLEATRSFIRRYFGIRVGRGRG